MKILAVDTSTTAGSACICENNKIIGEVYFNLEKTHSERILQIINYILKFTNVKLDEINLFVSGIGPGSFTGIRIGLSVMKGFSFALKKPLIGISSLDALAYNFYYENKYAAIIQGRNNEVFYAMYEWKNFTLNRTSEYICTKIAQLPEIKLAVTLDNSSLLNDKIKNLVTGNLFAHSFAKLGYLKFLDNKIANDVNPLYLKPSDAEINYLKDSKNLYVKGN